MYVSTPALDFLLSCVVGDNDKSVVHCVGHTNGDMPTFTNQGSSDAVILTFDVADGKVTMMMVVPQHIHFLMFMLLLLLLLSYEQVVHHFQYGGNDRDYSYDCIAHGTHVFINHPRLFLTLFVVDCV